MVQSSPIQMPLIAESLEFLYEAVEDDVKGDYDTFRELVQGLCDTGYLEMIQCSDDVFVYKAKTGTKWSDIVVLSDHIKKKILLQLIENPKCFFVLFNTQRGKLRIIGKEIASWIKLQNERVVSYLVVSNDKTLAEQSTNGLFSCFPLKDSHEQIDDPLEKYNVRIFQLSSNNKTSLTEIMTYIDAYAYNPSYPMPLIVLLANNKQIEKLVRILYHIVNHECPRLRAGGAWDEADQTYPQYREKTFLINGHNVNFLKLLNHPSDRIIRNGFVTATEGLLMDDEYEECTNAYHYPIEVDSVDQKNYFAFHHPECKKNFITAHSRESNNSIATRILNDNWNKHFNMPFTLKDGTPYYRKIIINSDSTVIEMTKLAKEFSDRANVITFNGHGIKLFNASFKEGKRYSARKQNLNKLLFYIYKMNHLNDMPLIILGRRKVDRGLGFHYAPRSTGPSSLSISGIDGILETNGIEGLIWTDMCMGNKIDHIPTSVQKAGRGAGIVRQCPQYPGEFHYWVEENTAQNIERHYKKVDAVNFLDGSNSMIQAITRAEASIPQDRRNHNVDEKTFRVIRGSSAAETLALTKRLVGKTFRTPTRDESGKYKTSLNNVSDVVELLEAVKKVPGSYGTNKGVKTYRRFLPCYRNLADIESLYCVIPLIDTEHYTQDVINKLDSEFGSNFISIPKEGDIP